MKKYLILLLLAITGCSSPLKKTQRYLFEHPEFSAGYCAEQFPVKDSIITKYDTVLEIGGWEIDSNVYIDSTGGKWVRDADSVSMQQPKVIYKTRTVIKTIYKDSIIYRRDPAREKELQLSLSACQVNNNDLLASYNKQVKLLAQWQGTAKKRWWIIFALIGGAVVYTGMKFKKFLV